MNASSPWRIYIHVIAFVVALAVGVRFTTFVVAWPNFVAIGVLFGTLFFGLWCTNCMKNAIGRFERLGALFLYALSLLPIAFVFGTSDAPVGYAILFLVVGYALAYLLTALISLPFIRYHLGNQPPAPTI